MSRASRLTGSVTALVGLPFLIALAAPEPTPPVPPGEAKLTVSSDSPDMSIRVVAVGAEPAMGAVATLASDDGRHTATVTTQPAADCPDDVDPLVLASQVGQRTSTWCLAVSGLPQHGTVSGTVTGAGPGERTALALTVRTREPFRWWDGWPFWLLIGGLAAALAVAVFLPLLTSGVTGVRLGLLLSVNDSRPVHQHIAGLRAWAATRRSAGTPAGGVLASLNSVVRNGPGHAATERGALSALVGDPPLPSSHPLLETARREAARLDHRITEFLSADGKTVPHPATVLVAAVTELAGLYGDLGRIAGLMHRDRPGDPMPREVDAARLSLDVVDDAADVPGAREAVESARIAVDLARADRTGTESDLRTGLEIAGISPPAWKTAGWFAAVGGLALVTLVAIAVALVFAGITVYVAAYDAKTTFGGFTDRLTLFSAALGSGVAATVLGLVAPWRDTVADAD